MSDLCFCARNIRAGASYRNSYGIIEQERDSVGWIIHTSRMVHPIEIQEPPSSERAMAPTATAAICGSFRRDPDGLRKVHRDFLSAGVAVLSPSDTDFIGDNDGFVYAAHEVGLDPVDIEANHLRAMQNADLVWLHAPAGYVGPSAAMELGFAHALGLPVYGAESPEDVVLASFVRVVRSPRAALAARGPMEVAQDAPTKSLGALQYYYDRAARDRGWAEETPEQSLLLLTEEVGELARALRKTKNGTTAAPGEDPSLELADVALYVVHLANVLGLDLASAVTAKEAINAERFLRRRSDLAA